MTTFKIIPAIYIVLIGSMLMNTACTDLDEKWYSEVTPETFFTSKESVNSVLVRSFTHWRWYQTLDRYRLQELTTDELATTQKGPHFESGGIYKRLHYHTWTPDEPGISETWRGTGMGIALAMESKEDLANVDYEKIGLSKQVKEAHQMQLQTLIAYFYLRGLDFFGGMPVFYSTEEKNIPRSTDEETFNHIERLLLEAIPALPLKVAGFPEDGLVRRAAAATLLAQLYFNSEAYIGKPMYDKCAKICQEIIDGEYGVYRLAENWYDPFHFENDKSSEIIWSAVSQNSKYEFNWFYDRFYPYEVYKYFNSETSASNGKHLQPSLKPNGQLYEFKLGKPFSKFHNTDLRKKPYVYRGNMNYEGMFLMGDLTNPITGVSALGVEEYKGKPLNMIDQVAQFSKVGKEYNSVEELPSTMSTGEENSGIRLVKMPQPDLADKSIRYNSDYPVIRLAEIYYMLGECKFRNGDKEEAALLFNQVRARNFPNEKDPDPVTASNIDKYRILDEWMIEFLGEGRRRTDLIRWDAFTTEEWWDHKPSLKEHLKRFPVPTSALSGSNILKQNPGYN